MITECYIKGRYDYGMGKCAVVITEDVPTGELKQVLHQAAWRTPDTWQYNGDTIEADQQNCEILAACYALDWCMKNGKQLVNIYANTETAQKWYLRGSFPEDRMMGNAYHKTMHQYDEYLEREHGEVIIDAIYADVIRKDDPNEFNQLVNRLAEQVK